jgi:hypothetical protein
MDIALADTKIQIFKPESVLRPRANTETLAVPWEQLFYPSFSPEQNKYRGHKQLELTPTRVRKCQTK